jgi:hypothetical protein
MSELNIREKWVYTQRPENERKFLASDMANALEVTLPTFYSLMKKLDLDNIKKPDGRGHNVMYFTHDALARCREELERRENAEKTKRETGRAELEAAQAEHPLVTDPRFLKLSYFPETTPACFSEVDE